MTDLFVVLALVANLLVALAVVAAIAAVVSRRARLRVGVLARAIGRYALAGATAVAAVTTAGSLYYSEHAGFVPCELCWYQRILMYPLVIVLGVALLRRTRGVWHTAALFVVIGAPISLYHWLVERVPSLAEGSSCSALVPCSVPYFERLGFVTLAWMCLSSFLLIAVLLVTLALAERATGDGARRGMIGSADEARPHEMQGSMQS